MNHPQLAASIGAPQESHVDLAMEQLAMHAVKLAVARWRIGYTFQETPPPTTQARYLARAQDQFAAWLEAGGFAQHEPEPVFSDNGLLECGGAPAANADANADASGAAAAQLHANASCPAGSICTA